MLLEFTISKRSVYIAFTICSIYYRGLSLSYGKILRTRDITLCEPELRYEYLFVAIMKAIDIPKEELLWQRKSLTC